MNPDLLVLSVALLIAAWFFFSGYFIGLAPFNFRDRLEAEEHGLLAPSCDEQARAPTYGPQRNAVLLSDLVQELAGCYGTEEIAIFDGDGLLLQGVAEEAMVGPKVAALALSRRFGEQASPTQTSVYVKEGGLGIHSLSCRVQPLWLVTSHANRAISEQDLSYLGQAVDRQWNWAA